MEALLNTNNQPPEFIFFDLDDTLLDDETSTRIGVDALFAKYSPATVAERHQRWNDALNQYYPSFLSGDIDVQQLQRARIRYVFPNLTFSDDEALVAFEYFMVNYVQGSTLFPETREVIQALKAQGIGLGVISNGPTEMQVRKLKAVSLYDDFDVVITAERAGVAKPDVAIFELALAEAGKAAADCWCVGDNLQNDVLAANQAGLCGVLLDRTGRQGQCSGKVIQTLREITFT
ncbi:MAG: hypothetical protein CSB47_08080 [Proteobacteria bacterium]|nr:MAG: hypothetical protein CSB47_08080 [Pseudomonadota bacterium]